MSPRPALSKAELEIAKIVWDLGEATVRQVLEALPGKRRLDYKTVQTFLRRLEEKGYLTANRDERSTTYKARVRPGQVIREAITDFVNRVFDGEPLPLVEQVIRDQGLSPEQIDKLRTMLDQLESQQEDSDGKRRR